MFNGLIPLLPWPHTASDNAPIITLLGNNPDTVPFSQVQGDGIYVDAGATAVDAEDGDLTSEIVIVGGGILDIATVGEHTINYSVTDSAGNTASVDRTVIVEAPANQAPIITLLGNNPDTVSLASSVLQSGSTYLGRNLLTEGSLSVAPTDGTTTVVNPYIDSQSVSGGYINHDIEVPAGTLGLRFATDGTKGDRNFEVFHPSDLTTPILTVAIPNTATTSNYMYISTLQDDPYADAGYTATDSEDGDITGDVVVAGDTVDLTTEGTYLITYNVSDSEGLPADEAVRTVNVQNTDQ